MTKSRLRLFVLPWLALLLALGCSPFAKPTAAPISTRTSPDVDVPALLKLNGQALALAQKTAPDAILRQVDTDLHLTLFHYTDRAATLEITIWIDAPTALVANWKIDTTTLSQLTGTSPASAVDLSNLIVGPQRVAQAVTSHWPGCTLRALTLYLENGKLTWAAFCNRSQGVVNGSMNAQTGVFSASDAPPAPVPVTATPLP